MFLIDDLTLKKIHTRALSKTIKVTKPPDAKLPMITIMEINLPIVYAFDLSTQKSRFSHFPFHEEIIFAAVKMIVAVHYGD